MQACDFLNSFYKRHRDEQKILFQAYQRVTHSKCSELLIFKGSLESANTLFLRKFKEAFFSVKIFKSSTDPLFRDHPYRLWLSLLEALNETLFYNEIPLWWKDFQESYGSPPDPLHVFFPQEFQKDKAVCVFRYYLKKYLQRVIREEFPLLLILEDLQWMDQASLQFLEELLLDRETFSFLIVGSYRDLDSESLFLDFDDSLFSHSFQTLTMLSPKELGEMVLDLDASYLLSLFFQQLKQYHFPFSFHSFPSSTPSVLFSYLALDKAIREEEDLADPKFFSDLEFEPREKGALEISKALSAYVNCLDPRLKKALEISSCIGSVISQEHLQELPWDFSLELLQEAPFLWYPFVREQTELEWIHPEVRLFFHQRLTSQERSQYHGILAHTFKKKRDSFFEVQSHLSSLEEGSFSQEQEQENAHFYFLAAQKAREWQAFSSAWTSLQQGQKFLSLEREEGSVSLKVSYALALAELSWESSEFEKFFWIERSYLKNVFRCTNKEKCMLYILKSKEGFIRQKAFLKPKRRVGSFLNFLN